MAHMQQDSVTVKLGEGGPAFLWSAQEEHFQAWTGAGLPAALLPLADLTGPYTTDHSFGTSAVWLYTIECPSALNCGFW
jgi:hypothetical protein